MEGDKYLEEDGEIIITDAENPNYPTVGNSFSNLLKEAEEKRKKYVSTLQESFRAMILHNLWKPLDECRQKDPTKIEKRLKLEVTEQLQKKICEQKKIIEELEDSNLKAMQLLKDNENKTIVSLEDKKSAIIILETEMVLEDKNTSEFLSYEPRKHKEEDEIDIKIKGKEDLQKHLRVYEVLPRIQIEKSVTSTNLYQSLSQFEDIDLLKYRITSIEIVKSQDKSVDLLQQQNEIVCLLESQSKGSDLLETPEKSDFLKSQDNIIDLLQSKTNISDLLESQDNISGFLQSQSNNSVVLQSQDDSNDFLQHEDKSVDFLQSQEKSINLIKQVYSFDNLRSENTSSEILSNHDNEEKIDTDLEENVDSGSKLLDKEVSKKIIKEESILKVLDDSLDILFNEALMDNAQLLHKNKGKNKSEETVAKKKVTSKSSKPIKKTALSTSVSKNGVISNMNVSSADLTRNETNNMQNKHKHKKKNIPRIQSDSISKLQGSFTCNELEKGALSPPSTSRKPKFSTPLSSNGKCGSNAIANSNDTVYIETAKGPGVNFIKRNVMRVSIFTKTSSKEDTDNIKIKSKSKVFTKRAKTKNIHTKAQVKTKKSICNFDSKTNETINYSSSNTNETQVNIFSTISDHKNILSVPFNERLSSVLDNSKKNYSCIEKFKTCSLNPIGVSKSDLNSLKDFISSMSAASVQSASVHSELKIEVPSENNTTTNKKLVVKFASEEKTSTEQNVSKDSIKTDPCNSNSSVSQTNTTQAGEIFIASVKQGSETSIEDDLVQETISHSSEYDLPKEAVATSDIQLHSVSIQEAQNNDRTIQMYVNNEIVRPVRLDEGDSGSSEMTPLSIVDITEVVKMRDKPCACVREWMNNKSEGDSAASIVMKSDLANKLQFGQLITEMKENIKRRNKTAQGCDGPRCKVNVVNTKSSNLFYNCSEDHNVNQSVNILQNIYESILRENRLEHEEIKPVKFKFPIECTCVQYVQDDYFGKGLGIENLYEIRNTETKSSCKMGICDEASNKSGSTSYSGSMYECVSTLSTDLLGCRTKVSCNEQEMLKKNVSSRAINQRQCSQQPSKASKCSSEPSCSILAIQPGKTGCAGVNYSQPCSCNLPARNEESCKTSGKRRKKDIVICDCKCCQEQVVTREDKATTCNLNCPSKNYDKVIETHFHEKTAPKISNGQIHASKYETVNKDINKTTTICQRCNREICATTEFCTICDTAPKSVKVQSDTEQKNFKIQFDIEKTSDPLQSDRSVQQKKIDDKTIDIPVKPEIQNLESTIKPRKCGSAPAQGHAKTVACKSCNREICVTTEFCTICDTAQKTDIAQQIDTAHKTDTGKKEAEKCGTVDKATNKKTVVCKSCRREICVTTEFCTICDPTIKTDAVEKSESTNKVPQKCESVPEQDKAPSKPLVVCKKCNAELCGTTEVCTISDIFQKKESSHSKQTIKFTDAVDSQARYGDGCACKNKDSLLKKIKMLVKEHMPDCDCPNHNKQKCQEPLQNFHSQSNLQTQNFEKVDKTRCCRSNNSLEDPCRLEGNTSYGNMTTRMIKSQDASYLLFSFSENFDNLIEKIASAFPECNCPPGHNCDQATIDRMLSVKAGDSPNKTSKGKCCDTKSSVSATISESFLREQILNTDELGLMEIKEQTDTSIMVKYEIPKLDGIKGYKLYVNNVFVQNLRCNTSTLSIITELPPTEKIYKIVCVKE